MAEAFERWGVTRNQRASSLQVQATHSLLPKLKH
jgi:hypothetical protein